MGQKLNFYEGIKSAILDLEYVCVFCYVLFSLQKTGFSCVVIIRTLETKLFSFFRRRYLFIYLCMKFFF